MPIRKPAAFAAMAVTFVLATGIAGAKELHPQPPNDDQSYLYVDPGYSRPNLPGYMQESMDSSNQPYTGTMFGEDEDAAPSPFGLRF